MINGLTRAVLWQSSGWQSKRGVGHESSAPTTMLLRHTCIRVRCHTGQWWYKIGSFGNKAVTTHLVSWWRQDERWWCDLSNNTSSLTSNSQRWTWHNIRLSTTAKDLTNGLKSITLTHNTTQQQHTLWSHELSYIRDTAEKKLVPLW